MTLEEITKFLTRKHIFILHDRRDAFRAGVGESVLETYRCRICRLRVKGYLNTSEENLKQASLPLHCGEWLVQEVMES